ncbi:hypothetical protein IWW48_001995 [Coemansia sp. RSA 1200]|nr:hypothetical protein IWW48_001995 [Coemansia sp. RSA 1200]
MSQDSAAVRPSRLVVNMVAYNGALAPLKVLVEQTKINRYAFGEVKELFLEIDTRNDAKANAVSIFKTNEESEALACRMARFLPDVKRLVVRTYGDDSDAWAFVKTLAETKKENDGSFQFDTNCAAPFFGWWFIAKALYNKV